MAAIMLFSAGCQENSQLEEIFRCRTHSAELIDSSQSLRFNCFNFTLFYGRSKPLLTLLSCDKTSGFCVSAGLCPRSMPCWSASSASTSCSSMRPSIRTPYGERSTRHAACRACWESAALHRRA